MSEDFSLISGDSALVEVTVVDCNGAPFDLTAVTEITFTMRRNMGEAVLLQKTLTGGGVTTPAPLTQGIIRVDIDPGDTDSMMGYKVYDIQVESIGEVYTVSAGTISIMEDVTI